MNQRLLDDIEVGFRVRSWLEMENTGAPEARQRFVEARARDALLTELASLWEGFIAAARQAAELKAGARRQMEQIVGLAAEEGGRRAVDRYLGALERLARR